MAGSWGGGKYEADAAVMEKGYSLKSLVAPTLKEAFLREGELGKWNVFLGEGRLIGSRETWWKAD